jgi:hypothetical protein
MAKVKYGAMVTDARGSIDGVVYSKSQYGAYVRVKVSPKQPQTAFQLNVRQTLAALSQAWGSVLDPGQRAAWKVFAAAHPVTDVFGNSQTLSAIAMYVRVNAVIIGATGTRIDDPPLTFSATPLATMAITMSTAAQSVSMAFTVTPLGADERLYIFATPTLIAGRDFYKPLLRFIGVSDAADASPFVATTLYKARFAADWLLGDRVAFVVAVVNETTGAVTVGLSQVVTTVA